MKLDLTAVDGLKRALEFYKNNASYMMTGIIPFPLFDLLGLNSSSNTVQEQRETAIKLIKAGRDSGVDKMEITIDQTAGIDIGPDIEGIPIKVKVGNNGKITLKVKYKNT